MDKSSDTKGKIFWLERPYKPGMKYNTKWLKQKKTVYGVAHREYHNTGTKAAQADRVAMLKATYKKHKAEGNSDRLKKVKKCMKRQKKAQRNEMKCAGVLGVGTFVFRKGKGNRYSK